MADTSPLLKNNGSTALVLILSHCVMHTLALGNKETLLLAKTAIGNLKLSKTSTELPI